MPGKQHAGAHVEPFVLSHDIHATILGLVGVEHPEPIQGQSVWPLVTGEAEDLHGDTIISGWTQRACVRDREWALIIDTIAEGARPELFHTGSDPYETENVAEEHPEIVTDRVRKLEDFLGGPLPYSYGHQVDLRNQMTLRRHLQIRRELGLPE
jgi:arylsulfatase A-like enzyme